MLEMHFIHFYALKLTLIIKRFIQVQMANRNFQQNYEIE